MKTILFQGDSITDAGRAREEKNYDNLGQGYPRLVEAAIGADCPGQYCFVNRGISGNRVVDLYARIKIDFINIKPDVLSILIGVNDVWHEFGACNGVDGEKFYKVYCMLIEEIREALPDVRIMILEPFVLRGPATAEHWQGFHDEVAIRAQKARMVAEKYGLTFVPLQAAFDEAVKNTPLIGDMGAESYWLKDGVHPTAKGHELIKRAWINAFNTLA